MKKSSHSFDLTDLNTFPRLPLLTERTEGAAPVLASAPHPSHLNPCNGEAHLTHPRAGHHTVPWESDPRRLSNLLSRPPSLSWRLQQEQKGFPGREARRSSHLFQVVRGCRLGQRCSLVCPGGALGRWRVPGEGKWSVLLRPDESGGAGASTEKRGSRDRGTRGRWTGPP